MGAEGAQLAKTAVSDPGRSKKGGGTAAAETAAEPTKPPQLVAEMEEAMPEMEGEDAEGGLADGEPGDGREPAGRRGGGGGQLAEINAECAWTGVPFKDLQFDASAASLGDLASSNQHRGGGMDASKLQWLRPADLQVGPGRIVALYHRSSTPYQVY
jgi:hypothetical protein